MATREGAPSTMRNSHIAHAMPAPSVVEVARPSCVQTEWEDICFAAGAAMQRGCNAGGGCNAEGAAMHRGPQCRGGRKPSS